MASLGARPGSPGVCLDWLWDDPPEERMAPGLLALRPRGAGPRRGPREQLEGVSAESGPRWSASRSDQTACMAPARSLLLRPLAQTPTPPAGPRCPASSRAGRYVAPGGASYRKRGLLRAASRFTMAQAAHIVTAPGAILRGDGLADSLERSRRRGHELARHQREHRAALMAKDRRRAAEWLRQQLDRRAGGGASQGHGHGGEAESMDRDESLSLECREVSASVHEDGEEWNCMSADRLSSPPSPRSRPRSSRLSAASDSGQTGGQQKVKFRDEASDERTSEGRGGSHRMRNSEDLDRFMWEYTDGQEGSADGANSEATESVRATSSMGHRADASPDDGAEGEASTAPCAGRRSIRRKSHMGAVKRMQKLLQARKVEFDSRPAAERERFRRAFASGDTKGKAQLDAVGVRIALAELGLRGSTGEEKDAIGELLKEARVCGAVNFFDFTFQIVPKAEQRLQEIRSPKWYRAFAEHDPVNSGRIGQAACWQAMRQAATTPHLREEDEAAREFWAGFERNFARHYEAVKLVDGAVDFAGFLELANTLDREWTEFARFSEHRAAQLGQLPQSVEKKHFGELAYMRRLFTRDEQLEDGSIEGGQVLYALLESGVLPNAGPVFDAALASIEDLQSKRFFRFADFLGMVDRYRGDEASSRHGQLQDMLMKRGSAPISREEMPKLAKDMGLSGGLPPTESLAALLEEANRGGLDHFEMAEAVQLLCRASELGRARARKHEAKVGKHLGIRNAAELMELRFSFAVLATSGVLGIPEARAMIQGLNSEVDPLDEDIEMLLEEVADKLAVYTADHQQKLPAVAAAEATRGSGQSKTGAERGFGRSDTMNTVNSVATSTAGGTRQLRFDGYLVLLSMVAEGGEAGEGD